jgi:hypothetical protein
MVLLRLNIAALLPTDVIAIQDMLQQALEDAQWMLALLKIALLTVKH